MNNIHLLGDWTKKISELETGESTKIVKIVDVDEKGICRSVNGFSISSNELLQKYDKIDNPFVNLSGMAQFNDFIQQPEKFDTVPTTFDSHNDNIVEPTKKRSVVKSTAISKESNLLSSLLEVYSTDDVWALKTKLNVPIQLPKQVIKSMMNTNIDKRTFISLLIDSSFDNIKEQIINTIEQYFNESTK